MIAQGDLVSDCREALVVFDDQVTVGWLKILKPGFRHCFLVVKEGAGWILYNPLSNRT